MQMMHIASTVPVQTACRVQPVSVPVVMAGVPSMYGLIVAVTQRHQLCVHRRRSAATQGDGSLAGSAPIAHGGAG